MTVDELHEVAFFLVDRFNYIDIPISDKVIALGSQDRQARIIIAISLEEETMDVAFSPIALPSEIAMVIIAIQEEYHYDIRVTQDFYLASDKEMYLGFEAMSKFAEDLYNKINDLKFKQECEDDGSPLLDESVFIVKEPIEVATPEKLKNYKPMRKYSKLWYTERRKK